MTTHKLIVYIVMVLLVVSIALAVDVCPSSLHSSSVYVQWANYTAATYANVTLRLWNGSSYLMTNMGGGVYNFSYYVPAYNENGSNTYYNYFNSTNPTTTGAEDFTVKSTCSTTNGSTSYLPIILIIAVLMASMFYIGMTLMNDHYPIKLFMLLLGIILFVPLTQLASIIATVEGLEARVITIVNIFSYVSIFVAIMALFYFMIYLIKTTMFALAKTAELRRGGK